MGTGSWGQGRAVRASVVLGGQLSSSVQQAEAWKVSQQPRQSARGAVGRDGGRRSSERDCMGGLHRLQECNLLKGEQGKRGAHLLGVSGPALSRAPSRACLTSRSQGGHHPPHPHLPSYCAASWFCRWKESPRGKEGQGWPDQRWGGCSSMLGSGRRPVSHPLAPVHPRFTGTPARSQGPL